MLHFRWAKPSNCWHALHTVDPQDAKIYGVSVIWHEGDPVCVGQRNIRSTKIPPSQPGHPKFARMGIFVLCGQLYRFIKLMELSGIWPTI